MTDTFGFSADGARRIVRTVRRSEGETVTGLPPKKRRRIRNSNCATIADIFDMPDQLPPDVEGWVPKLTIVADAVACELLEVKECPPAAAAARTIFDTHSEAEEYAEPSAWQSGTLLLVTNDDDPDLRVTNAVVISGPLGQPGQAFQPLGITNLDRRQWAAYMLRG